MFRGHIVWCIIVVGDLNKRVVHLHVRCNVYREMQYRITSIAVLQ